MEITDDLVEGLFIEESKNRFLCKVQVKGEVIECYVPSSSRLTNYLILKNKLVLLTQNKDAKSRTKYSMFAVSYFNKYIILNMNLVSKILASLISNKELFHYDYNEIFIEKTVNGYKADVVIVSNDEKIIVEAKSIISLRREANFPTVYSERSIGQLKVIKEQLINNQKVHYIIVSLSTIVRKIKISNKFEEFYRLFCECIELGMKLSAISISLDNKHIKLYRNLPITSENFY